MWYAMCVSHCTVCSDVRYFIFYILYFIVHTMKLMHIGSELIRSVCVHTECALTTIRTECAFDQFTSIGGLKLVCR